MMTVKAWMRDISWHLTYTISLQLSLPLSQWDSLMLCGVGVEWGPVLGGAGGGDNNRPLSHTQAYSRARGFFYLSWSSQHKFVGGLFKVICSWNPSEIGLNPTEMATLAGQTLTPTKWHQLNGGNYRRMQPPTQVRGKGDEHLLRVHILCFPQSHKDLVTHPPNHVGHVCRHGTLHIHKTSEDLHFHLFDLPAHR